MLKLSDPIEAFPLIGPKYTGLLSKIGIERVEDLLFYFPVNYKNTSQIYLLSELDSLENKTVQVTVESIKNFRTKFGKFITQAKVYDTSGIIDVIWFNQKFLTRVIKVGSTILLNGKIGTKYNKPQLYSPTYEVLKSNSPRHLGRIVPIYPLTDGITNKWLRTRIAELLSEHSYLIDEVQNQVPHIIQKRYDLEDLNIALRQIHFPDNEKSQIKARKRIAFEELLTIQLKLVKKIFKNRKQDAPKIKINTEILDKFLISLPFKPTTAQRRVIYEILKDFEKNYPANRLLQGDVGSGKTLVAAAVSILIIKSGYQVALMAPTAILAEQHFDTLQNFLKEFNISMKLITATSEESTGETTDTDSTKANLVIGTHALLHRKESLFKKLGLLIVDEQHRFGVKQREALAKLKTGSFTAHNITMTATPIPRSIALTLFGDLDISILDEMPTGRLPTKTFLVPQEKRLDAYKWIEKMIRGGNISGGIKSQVFWLCPLIEESDKLQTKAVITEYERLENEIFPELKIDLLHGRLSEAEKNDKIKRVKEHKTDVLVSTTVIEVGMDIPDANIIVIEGAERFGLAQLHQLRGRVGRRADQESWCFLFPGNEVSPEAIKRLKYFSDQNDGLKVAEFDLKRRGPGEVYGTLQAGIPNLKVASLGDIELIQQTREAAQKILSVNRSL